MTGSMTGRVAVVTGGGSGIGRASAVALARSGAAVTVGDIDGSAAERVAAEVVGNGGQARAFEADVCDAKAVALLIDGALSAFGRLDCAVNSAGIAGPVVPTAEYDEAQWRRVVEVNLIGLFLCVAEEVRAMLNGGRGGSIVNVSSGAGLSGFKDMGAYTASKHGVLGFTKSVALEYADAGIRVNAICPGAIATPLLDEVMQRDPRMYDRQLATTPMGRLGRPEEVADAVTWLCSDLSSYVSGVSLPVDGATAARHVKSGIIDPEPPTDPSRARRND